MHNRFIGSMMVVVAALVFSPGVFAQTYGSLGDAPGAWKPDQLPPELSKPKPFDPHDLSAVWAAPTLRDDVHWLGEHGGQDQDAAGPDILDKRPPFTPFGLEVVETHFPGSNGDKDAWSLRGRARINGYDNSPVSICEIHWVFLSPCGRQMKDRSNSSKFRTGCSCTFSTMNFGGQSGRTGETFPRIRTRLGTDMRLGSGRGTRSL